MFHDRVIWQCVLSAYLYGEKAWCLVTVLFFFINAIQCSQDLESSNSNVKSVTFPACSSEVLFVNIVMTGRISEQKTLGQVYPVAVTRLITHKLSRHNNSGVYFCRFCERRVILLRVLDTTNRFLLHIYI